MTQAPGAPAPASTTRRLRARIRLRRSPWQRYPHLDGFVEPVAEPRAGDLAAYGIGACRTFVAQSERRCGTALARAPCVLREARRDQFLAAVSTCARGGGAAAGAGVNSRSLRSWCSDTSWRFCAASSRGRGWRSPTGCSWPRPAGCWAVRAGGRPSFARTRCLGGIASWCGNGGRTQDGGRAGPRSRRRFVPWCCDSRVRIRDRLSADRRRTQRCRCSRLGDECREDPAAGGCATRGRACPGQLARVHPCARRIDKSRARDGGWAVQQARQFAWSLVARPTPARFLIHDRDNKFSRASTPSSTAKALRSSAPRSGRRRRRGVSCDFAVRERDRFRYGVSL
jgi:hypothetical protein